jgi:hypothetical protein
MKAIVIPRKTSNETMRGDSAGFCTAEVSNFDLAAASGVTAGGVSGIVTI